MCGGRALSCSNERLAVPVLRMRLHVFWQGGVRRRDGEGRSDLGGTDEGVVERGRQLGTGKVDQFLSVAR